MYGLVQAVIISHNAPKAHFSPYGFAPAQITQVICTQKYQEIHFTILVDDFGMNCTKKHYVEHLVTALKTKYEVIQDW